MKTVSLVAGFLCVLPFAGAFAADTKPEALDNDLKAIIAKVLDKDIEDISALKNKYPELEHFGEAPWFTRGEGDFRYDYKTEAAKGAPNLNEDSPTVCKALPGGCGLYFHLRPTGAAGSKWSDYYERRVIGSDYAGITYEFSITVDAKDDALRQAIAGVIDRNEGLCGKLTSEYLLTKNGVKLGTPFLLRALESPDQDVYRSAIHLLGVKTLTGDELAALKDGFINGRNRLEVATDALNIVKQQDNAHLADFELGMAGMAIKSEASGDDPQMKPPYGFSPRLYYAGQVREWIMSWMRGSKEERFIPVAMCILNDDTGTENQFAALEYFKGLPPEKSRPAFIAALRSPRRTVQARAAELIGSLRITGTEEPLKALLLSPGSKVRLAAAEALRQLGVKPPDALPPRTLPESAVHIADVLWKCGLTDEEIVAISSMPKTKVSDPLPVKPDIAQLPGQVTLTDDKTTTNTMEDGTVASTLHYHLELNDPWRMTKADADSVKKRGLQYAFGFGAERGGFMDASGQVLLAAALKWKDMATAQAVYEKLCDELGSDGDILSRGVQGLGWLRFCDAMRDYQQRNDDAALESFFKVVSLKKYRQPTTFKPNDFLAGYIQQSRLLIADLARRKVSEPDAAPIFPEAKGCISYWSTRFPNKAERIKALIIQLDDVGTRDAAHHGAHMPQMDPILQTLVNEGDDAVGPLIDCLERDMRLTRIAQPDWDHGYMPVFFIGTVREAAYVALCGLLNKDFLAGKNYGVSPLDDTEHCAAIAADIRKYLETRKAQPPANP